MLTADLIPFVRGSLYSSESALSYSLLRCDRGICVAGLQHLAGIEPMVEAIPAACNVCALVQALRAAQYAQTIVLRFAKLHR